MEQQREMVPAATSFLVSEGLRRGSRGRSVSFSSRAKSVMQWQQLRLMAADWVGDRNAFVLSSGD